MTGSVAIQLPSQHCCGGGAVEEEAACFDSDDSLMLIFAVALLNQLKEECIQKQSQLCTLYPSRVMNVTLCCVASVARNFVEAAALISSPPTLRQSSLVDLCHTSTPELRTNQKLAFPRLFESRFSSSGAIGGLSRHRPNCKNGGWARNKRPRLALGGAEKTLITRSVGESGNTPGCEQRRECVNVMCERKMEKEEIAMQASQMLSRVA